MDKIDCQHYDYGKSAPRQYGAFCTLTNPATVIYSETCKLCKDYQPTQEAKL